MRFKEGAVGTLLIIIIMFRLQAKLLYCANMGVQSFLFNKQVSIFIGTPLISFEDELAYLHRKLVFYCIVIACECNSDLEALACVKDVRLRIEVF